MIFSQTEHKQDMWELFFDFSLTSYIRDTWNIDFLMNNMTGKFEGFAFIRTLAHVTDELIKFDGIT